MSMVVPAIHVALGCQVLLRVAPVVAVAKYEVLHRCEMAFDGVEP